MTEYILNNKMRLFYAAIVLSLYRKAQLATDVCTVRPVDVLFIMDSSGSVSTSAFQLARDFVSSFKEHVVIGAACGFQISVISFSTSAVIQFYLNTFADTLSLGTAINNVNYFGDDTHTAIALQLTFEVFKPANGMRNITGMGRYVVVMTDGQSNDKQATEVAAADLKISGVVDKVFAIGIGNADRTELIDIASSPDDDTPETWFQVANFNTLQTLVEQMVDIICDGVDSCSNHSCVHGECVHTVDSFTCSCDTEYAGVNCEFDKDNGCASYPCMNGGICLGTTLGFNCTCLDGYTGEFCQTDVDECASFPCANNGTCLDAVNEYTCNCVDGFTDQHCRTNIDDCASSPCVNNGTCLDDVNIFTCHCLDGFTGGICETDIDECVGVICINNGTCLDAVNGYTCNCVDGFTGQHCTTNVDECASFPCVNNGTCLDAVSEFTCNCVDGFTGQHCHTNIDDCASSPCVNNGTCRDDVNTFTCHCLGGFTGSICETELSDAKNDNTVVIIGVTVGVTCTTTLMAVISFYIWWTKVYLKVLPHHALFKVKLPESSFKNRKPLFHQKSRYQSSAPTCTQLPPK